MFANNEESYMKDESFYEEIANKSIGWPSFGVKCSDDEKLIGTVKSSAASLASLLPQDRIVPEGSLFGEKHFSPSSSAAGNVVSNKTMEMRKCHETYAFNLKSILKRSDKQQSEMSFRAKHQQTVRFASPVVHVKLIEELEENSEDDTDTLILTPDEVEMNDESLTLENSESGDQKVPIHSQSNDDFEFCPTLEPFQEKLCSKHYPLQTENGTVHGETSKHIPVFFFPKPIASTSFSISLPHLETKESNGPLTSYCDVEESPGCAEYKGFDEYPGAKKPCVVEEYRGSDGREDCALLKLDPPKIRPLDVISEHVENIIATNNKELAKPDDADKLTPHDEDLSQNSEDQVQIIRNSSQEPISAVQVVPSITRSEDIVCHNPFQVSKTSIKTTFCTSVYHFLDTAIIDESLFLNIDADNCSTNALSAKSALFSTEDLEDNMLFYIDYDNASEKFDYGKPEEFTCSPIKELIKSAKEDEYLYELSLRNELVDTLEGSLESQVSINGSPDTVQPSVAPYLLEKTINCANGLLKNSDKVLERFTCSPVEQGCSNDFIACDQITRTPYNNVSECSQDSQNNTKSEKLQDSSISDTPEKDENGNEKVQDCLCISLENSLTNENCQDKVLNNGSNSQIELVSGDPVKYLSAEGDIESTNAVSVMKISYLDNSFVSFFQPRSRNLCEMKIKEVETSAINRENENVSYVQDIASFGNCLGKKEGLPDNPTNLEDFSLNPKRKKVDKNEDDTVATKSESLNFRDKANSANTSNLDQRAFVYDKTELYQVYRMAEAKKSMCKELKEQKETLNGKHLMSKIDMEGPHSKQKETDLYPQTYRPLVSATELDSNHKCRDRFQPQAARDYNCKGFDQNKCSGSCQHTLDVLSAEGMDVLKEIKKATACTIPSTLIIDIHQLNEPELLEALTIDIGKLDEPELLEAAMLLVENALNKTKAEKPRSSDSVETSKHSNSTPAFFWRNKFPYHSKQLELAETFSTDKLSETSSYHHSAKSTTCTRPLRTGLSRRQKVKKLHPYWEKGRTITDTSRNRKQSPSPTSFLT